MLRKWRTLSDRMIRFHLACIMWIMTQLLSLTQKLNNTLLWLKHKPYHDSYHCWAHLISPLSFGQLRYISCASCILTSNLSNCSTSVGTCFSLSKSANKGGIMFICLVKLTSTVFRISFNLWVSNCLPFSVLSRVHVRFFSNYSTDQWRYCTWWPTARLRIPVRAWILFRSYSQLLVSVVFLAARIS